MKARITLSLAIVIICILNARADDVKDATTAFQKFATAVKEEKLAEAAKFIAPPGDQFWTAFAAARPDLLKYGAALDAQFGKPKDEPPSPLIDKAQLQDFLYEVLGDIRDMKAAGKDTLHVTTWTTRPDSNDKLQTAIYERKFTAVKVGEQWRFHLHIPGSGTPVLKKVPRVTADKKAAEVYAEHSPGLNEKDWKELDPITHDGKKNQIQYVTGALTKIATVLPGEIAKVKSGQYPTRKAALEALDKSMQVK